MAEAERRAEIARTTKETDVRLDLSLDGTGQGTRRTGVGFLDHMRDLLAWLCSAQGEAARERFGQHGRATILASHTCGHRADQLLGLL